MDIIVRSVREQDAGAIVALLNPIITAGTYSAMREPVTVEGQIAFIRGLPERAIYHAVVADGSGALVGIQDVLPAAGERAGEISTFVALDAHRTGVGAALSDATFRAAPERGFTKLIATIRADNPGAIAFYRSRGFEIVDTSCERASINGRLVERVRAEKTIV